MKNVPVDHLLSPGEMAAFGTYLANERPDLVRVGELGKSRDGKAIQMLTITDFSMPEVDSRPIFLLHGCIHAVELLGGYMALEFARQLVENHCPGGILERVAFVIIPCMNPDGVEYIVATGGSVVRSRHEVKQRYNVISQRDIDGDGLTLSMIHEEEDGDLIRDPLEPRLLIPRTPDSKGPFYRMYPEGMVENWDGGKIRSFDHYIDWNRNFCTNWVPEPIDASGDYPMAEVEIRQLVEFVSRHVTIFMGVGLHGGPGTIVAPPGSMPASSMIPQDAGFLRDLGKIGEKIMGMPYFVNSSYNLPPWRWMNYGGERHGSFMDFMYLDMGIPAVDIELNNSWDCAGVGCRRQDKIQSWEEYNEFNRDYLRWLDAQGRDFPVFHDWKKVEHPQLGTVEVGGYDQRYQFYLPKNELPVQAKLLYGFIMKAAEFAPGVRWKDCRAEHLDGNVWRLRATVENFGAMPSNLTFQGGKLKRFSLPEVIFSPEDGVELLSMNRNAVLEHLGKYSVKTLEWFVRVPTETKKIGEALLFAGAAGNASLTFTVERS